MKTSSRQASAPSSRFDLGPVSASGVLPGGLPGLLVCVALGVSFVARAQDDAASRPDRVDAEAPAETAVTAPAETEVEAQAGTEVEAQAGTDEATGSSDVRAEPGRPSAETRAALLEGPIAPLGDAPRERLISGAPLHDPDVRVHVLQKKSFPDAGRHELVLYPFAGQVNGRFTQHWGSAARYVYHLQEHFAFQVTPLYNWYADESSFNAELINKVREEAQAATSLLLDWGVLGGIEVTPLYGKVTFYNRHLIQFGLVLTGGAGIGQTRHQLRPRVGGVGPTFGDTGQRFMASVGAGLRMQFGRFVTVRLELRDVMYTARVDSVNGCNAGDLEAMDAEFQQAGFEGFSGSVDVRPSCNLGAFEGEDPATGEDRSNDVPLALNLVRVPSSDVLNNLGLYLGIGVQF